MSGSECQPITGSSLSTSWSQVSSTLTSPLDAVTLKLELSGTQFSGWLAWDDASVSLDAQVITKYYYAGGQRVAVRKGDELSYLLGDHLGSASVVTDIDGGLLSETMYKPWGEIRYSGGAVMPTDRLYTGQIAEPILGLYFYNARWYDSSLSRFAQADTIIPNPGDPQSWDRYSYVRNSPTGRIDPTGHMDDEGGGDDKIGTPNIINILICGRDSQTCGSSSDLTGYANDNGNFYIFDVDGPICNSKAACANYISEYINQHPNIDFNLIGHSAGADVAILVASRSVSNGFPKIRRAVKEISNIRGIALLDPSLTSAGGYGFPAYEGDDYTYGTNDDLGPLIHEILSENIQVFVGLGKDSPASLQTYISGLATNQSNSDLQQDLSRLEYRFYKDYLHYQMATEVQVQRTVLDFLK